MELLAILFGVPALTGMPLLVVMGPYGFTASIPALIIDKGTRWAWMISAPFVWWVYTFLYEQQKIENRNNPSLAGDEYTSPSISR